MYDFSDLTAKDCPLLGEQAAPVLGQYNQAVQVLRQIAKDFPSLFSDQRVKKRIEELNKIREALTRARYVVGFAGRSGSTKSSTLNKIVEQEVMLPGLGKATTSAVTRVRPRRLRANELLLRYLTQPEYEKRRNSLCDVVGLNLNVYPTDEKLQAGLPKYRRETSGVPDHDFNALQKLVNSYLSFKGFVRPGPPRQQEPAPYEKRGEFLNHSSENTEPETRFLLKDAIIDLVTDRISEKLEIVDLPGIGAQGILDTILTREVLPELDGALVFIRGDLVGDRELEIMMNLLKGDYRLGNRLWIVFTKMDAVVAEQWYGNKTGKTIFDTYKELLKNHGIALDHLYFVSNIVAGLKGSPDYSRRALAKLNLEIVSDKPKLQYRLPPALKNEGSLRTAFDALLADGGIGRLRELITSELAGQVGAEIRLQAEGDLGPITRALQEDLEYERKVNVQGPQDVDRANQCHDAISKELIHWEDDRIQILEGLGRDLEEKLLSQVATVIDEDPKVLAKLKRRDPNKESGQVDELASRLGHLVNKMDATLRKQLNQEIFPKVFKDVGIRLMSLPALWNKEGPAQLWARYGEEDQRENDGWRTQLFPSFSCGTILAELPASFPLAQVRPLMQEKAVCASRQAMNGVKVRVRQRLEELLAKVARLAFHRGAADNNA